MVHGDTWIGSTRYSNYLEDCWPCAGGLSAVNVIGTQSHDVISGLTQWRLTVEMDLVAESGRNPVSKSKSKCKCKSKSKCKCKCKCKCKSKSMCKCKGKSKSKIKCKCKSKSKAGCGE